MCMCVLLSFIACECMALCVWHVYCELCVSLWGLGGAVWAAGFGLSGGRSAWGVWVSACVQVCMCTADGVLSMGREVSARVRGGVCVCVWGRCRYVHV